LQTEIKRLRQKYPTQQTVSRVMPVVTKASTAIPINQLRLAQAAQLLQPAMQKQSLIQVSSPIPVRATLPMITASMEVESSGSYQSPNRRQVVSDLPVATVNTYLPKPLAVFKGYMWPAKGVVTSPMAGAGDACIRELILRLDWNASFAAAPGVVVTAGWSSGGYGNLVDVQHADGSLTRYAHNSRVLVQVGQMVAQGQEISEMGSSGFSTGPHCHFEVHPRGHGAVNPIAIYRVRLANEFKGRNYRSL
jgi:murein DD-endopeptidase MepM/ murein hydrolase activator NlpD